MPNGQKIAEFIYHLTCIRSKCFPRGLSDGNLLCHDTVSVFVSLVEYGDLELGRWMRLHHTQISHSA